MWLPAAAASLMLVCTACGSKSATRDTASTARTSTARTATVRTAKAAAPASGCRVAPRALTTLVLAGLAFPGPAKLLRAHVVGRPGTYYFAAQIVPPGKRAAVGTGVWTATSLSPKNGVVAVNKTAGAYSDWRRADLPLTPAARRWVARATRCSG
jgi:hypothetical protein